MTPNLYFYTNGDPTYHTAPLVLIHGAGGHHLFWPPQIRRMHGRRVFAVDLPAHGRSDGIGRDRIEDYVEDVLEFMGKAGINSAVWVGHSMGGAIALQAALNRPRSVLGLMLIGVGARMRVDPDLMEYTTREASFPAAINIVGERAFSESAPARLRQLAVQRLAEIRRTVLQGDFQACEAFDVSERLGDVRAPTLILVGAKDRLVPTRLSSILHRGIVGSELVELPEAGHMVILEKPEETAAVLRRFADSIPYRPGDV